MNTVLLVDDEMIVRYGTKSMIDWERIGLVVVGEAANGLEALGIFESEKPDIVITDIKMPIMDGIELMREIRKRSRSTRIVILSCLQDFEYAKEALRQGAAEYLIKSDMMPADLENVLLQVKRSIELDLEEHGGRAPAKSGPLIPETIAKEKFLRDLSTGHLNRSAATAEAAGALGLEAFRERLVLLQIEVDYYERLVSAEGREPSDIANAVAKALDESLGDARMPVERFDDGNGGWTVLVRPDGDADSAAALAKGIIERIGMEPGIGVTAGISGVFEQLGSIRVAYEQAKEALRAKLFLGCGSPLRYDRLPRRPAAEFEDPILFKQLNSYVQTSQQAEALACVARIFEGLRRQNDPERVHMISLELLLSLHSAYADIESDHAKLARRKKEHYEQIKCLETLDDYEAWFRVAYAALLKEMRELYSNDRNSILKAVRYIQSHYAEDISLQSISGYANLSKNYFANLFKKEMKESFVEYLTRIRIETAKTLIKNTELKSADIGARIGIGDAKYFSKVFKKTTGLTPSEYKDRVR